MGRVHGKRFIGFVLGILVCVCLVGFLPGVPAWAVPPSTINVHGQLVDGHGHALTGDRNYRVRFFDSANGGAQLGGNLLGSAALSAEGLFNIVVTLPPEVAASAAAWYEIAVDSDATPNGIDANDVFPDRVAVQSVPFAVQSGSAIHVEASAVGNGTVSNTELETLDGVAGPLQTQLGAKANATDVYSKAQVDTSQASQNTTIAGKADASNVYTKAQVDAAQTAQDTATNTALAAKANGGDVYTKAQVDATQASQNTTIAGKADAANVYTKAQVDTAQTTQDAATGTALAAKANSADVYTKTQVDNSQAGQNTTIAGKVAKAGDTMTGALNITGGFIGLGKAAAPKPVTDCLYNVGGTVFFAGTQLGYPWSTIAGTAQQAVPNHGYMTNNAALVTITLPASASVDIGDTVRVNGLGTGGWKLAQNAGQKILVGTLNVPDYSVAWTPRDNARRWFWVASSSDGTKLTACVGGDISTGKIYTSTDSGATWTPRQSGHLWNAVASSSDGTKLVAYPSNEPIYTSTDSGVNWTARDSARNWNGVASSSDGTKLVACVDNGQIYTSTDSGATWTPRDSSRQWNSVASSADGAKLVASVLNGQLYTSTDSGATWTPRDSTRQWCSVASSSDGTKLVACVGGGLNVGNIYTSTDSGMTWTPRENDRNWISVASSSDGARLVACVYNGQLYTSTDSGMTWTARDSNRVWQAVASSSDGTKLVASVDRGQIYTLDTHGAEMHQTTAGTAGSLSGGQDGAIELQYIGNSTFKPVSHEGSLGAF